MATADLLAPRLDAFLERLVSEPDGGPPGAVLLVRRHGTLVYERAAGVAQLPEAGAPARAMRPDTIFDLGSITKVVATTATMMSLVERGVLELDAPVANWLDWFTGQGKERITLRHLLMHRAGLWEWWPVYLSARSPAAAIDLITSLDLRYPVDSGRHYSDLGFMLLGEIVARATGEPLDWAAHRLVFDPLKLGDTGFRPDPALVSRIAATSRGDRYEREMIATGEPYPVPVAPAGFEGWRSHTLVGEVNDGNAHHAFGGVAGHAGLFSTANDLAAFGAALAAGGTADGTRIWQSATIALFTAEHRDPGQGLGFWTRRLADIGDRRDGGFGHGGFPGTELLIHGADDLVVVLLTNRLHARGPAPDLDPAWREVLGLVAGPQQWAPGERRDHRPP
jgi:serine-type D-Ala-D-Ala carboxypeptidase